MKEQLYIFIDKTGVCFKEFQSRGSNDGERKYNDMLGTMLRGGKKFIVGDMLTFRDDLLNAGYEWGIDFYVRKAGFL